MQVRPLLPAPNFNVNYDTVCVLIDVFLSEGISIELWDLYNKNRELVGTDHIRGNEIPDGCFHLVVHVWIRNRDGKYLISQRSADRPTFPLMYETVGGSVVKGEDSLTGAIREVKEEVGLDLSPDNGRLIHSKIRKVINGVKFNDILDVYLFEYDDTVNLKAATTNEVEKIEWLTKEQIESLLDAGKMVRNLNYFSEIVSMG